MTLKHLTACMSHGCLAAALAPLQGIGMTLENHIEFWRREMAPKTPEDKFRKDHLYNIRHAHGKEGGRKDYTPMNCLTIISKVPGNVGLGLRKALLVDAVSEVCLAGAAAGVCPAHQIIARPAEGCKM